MRSRCCWWLTALVASRRSSLALTYGSGPASSTLYTSKRTMSSSRNPIETSVAKQKKRNRCPVSIEECGYSNPERSDVLAALLNWWDDGHRTMPWRKELGDRPPFGDERWAYQVWVSEVMLQQTQVDRVVPYYQAWIRRWPSVQALAQATEDEVKAAWTGLGYYRRAKFLLQGAVQISASKRMPRSRQEWLQIKGVGAYTAAAIASICYDERTPVVDGNVVRVLSRHRAYTPSATETWRIAQMLVDERCDRPGDVNQAMMELGATVCTKAKPKCEVCPLAQTCQGKAAPFAYYPVKKDKKAAPKHVKLLVCVLQRKPRQELPLGNYATLFSHSLFGVNRAPDDALRLASLWRFPSREISPQGANLDREIDHILADFGLSDAPVAFRAIHAKPVLHSITDTRYSIHVAWLVLQPFSAAEPATTNHDNLNWLTEAELGTKAASSILGKCVRHARSLATCRDDLGRS